MRTLREMAAALLDLGWFVAVCGLVVAGLALVDLLVHALGG